MATNLALDDKLLNQAVMIGGLKTKKDTVNLALQEFIQRRKAEEQYGSRGVERAFIRNREPERDRRAGGKYGCRRRVPLICRNRGAQRRKPQYGAKQQDCLRRERRKAAAAKSAPVKQRDDGKRAEKRREYRIF